MILLAVWGIGTTALSAQEIKRQLSALELSYLTDRDSNYIVRFAGLNRVTVKSRCDKIHGAAMRQIFAWGPEIKKMDGELFRTLLARNERSVGGFGIYSFRGKEYLTYTVRIPENASQEMLHAAIKECATASFPK